MATGQLQGVVSYLRRAVSPRDGAGASDAQLLQRYATQQDEPAFELLVWRHAQLVLGTARRVVADEQTAEDCFQAVFLALAQAAEGVGRSGSVGGWLCKVAYRVARKARVLAQSERRGRFGYLAVGWVRGPGEPRWPCPRAWGQARTRAGVGAHSESLAK
jgi:DNA-directed RNA polymerase specialized sigma24 family protein